MTKYTELDNSNNARAVQRFVHVKIYFYQHYTTFIAVTQLSIDITHIR